MSKNMQCGILMLLALPVLVGCVQYSRSAEELRTVPDDIPENTTVLNLNNNSISVLESSSFEHLHLCQILDISLNKLQFIQNDSFKGLQNLRVLNISFNFLFTFSIHEIWDLQSLIQLDLRNNSLETLDGGSVYNLSKLQEIILDNNHLLYIDEDVFFPRHSLDYDTKIISFRGNNLCHHLWLLKTDSIELIYDEEQRSRCSAADSSGGRIREENWMLEKMFILCGIISAAICVTILIVFIAWKKGKLSSRKTGSRECEELGVVKHRNNMLILKIDSKSCHSFVPSLMSIMNEYLLRKTTPNPAKSFGVKEAQSALFQKGYKTFLGMRVFGQGGILKCPDSAVELLIPEGLKGFVMGHVHTDVKPFIHAIPVGECVIAPVVEYHQHVNVKRFNMRSSTFEIKVPHCLTKAKDLETVVVVRHGNIHTNSKFRKLPTATSFFNVDEKFIIIYTTSFSQFICTSCNRICYGQGKAFVFGNILHFPDKRPTASVRLYICSPLYELEDYEKKIVKSEADCGRALVSKDGILWNHEECAAAESMLISVQSGDWDPRPPIKSRQEWNSEIRKLTKIIQAREMYEMFVCHTCKSDPTILATFDYFLPRENHGENVSFSGLMEMVCEVQNNNQMLNFQIHVDISAFKMLRSKLNKEQLVLKKFTDQLITSDDDLVTFGLHLGFTCETIKQTRTNHPHSVEGAALDLVCRWWDQNTDTEGRKAKVLIESLQPLRKTAMVPWARKTLQKINESVMKVNWNSEQVRTTSV